MNTTHQISGSCIYYKGTELCKLLVQRLAISVDTCSISSLVILVHWQYVVGLSQGNFANHENYEYVNASS